MRELDMPAAVTLPITDTLADIAPRNAAQWPDRVMYTRNLSSGPVDVTAAAFNDDVRATAKGLMARGIKSGDRVGVLAANSYEWTTLDFALWTVGACAVPIYESSSSEQIDWIVTDAGVCAVAVGSPALADKVRSAVTGECPPIWPVDDRLLPTLGSEGQQISDDELRSRTDEGTPQDTATIIYTSGTTGQPKGCELTHANFLFEVRTLVASTAPLMAEPGACTVLFLPLAHIFGRAAQVWCAEGGLRVIHCANPKTLTVDMVTFSPTFIVAVPRVFEKIYNASAQKAQVAGRGKIFDRAVDVAIAYSRAQYTGGPSVLLRLQHAIFDRLVYAKLRAALGGRAKYAVSGGAGLGERLGHFFAGIGLLVMEGYGLTETTGPSAFNRPEAPRIGTVGQAMAGTAVRIADDGEVWLRGPHVMRGYHNNPEATTEAIDSDGWFHTGDIGVLDDDGYLSITGRKKDIIITAGGKNVAPAVLEDRVQSSRLVSYAMVVGEGRPFIGALVTLDEEALAAWVIANDKSELSAAEVRADPALQAEVQLAINHANDAVSKAESIRKWTILDGELSEEAGHVTSTQKLKRTVIATDFATEIEALYTQP